MSSHRKLRIAVIGIDGANVHTSKLLGLDNVYLFKSTIPPFTPPSWTSILTGSTPAKHGIVGWFKVNRHDWKLKLATSYDVKALRISEILDLYGLKSVLINLPLTYPFGGINHKNNSVIISDWAAPKQEIFPRTLNEKYREYLHEPPHNWWAHKEENSREYSEYVKEYTETRINLYRELMENLDWQLYFIVFSEIDWFSHLYPKFTLGEIPNRDVKYVLNRIREFIQDIESLADVVFFVSDHGFNIKIKRFYVNEALSKIGVFKYRKFKTNISNIISRVIPKQLIVNMTKNLNGPQTYSEYISSSKSKAAMLEAPTWGIFVKDYSVVPLIKSKLAEYPEIKEIVEAKDIYSGPQMKLLPDLFVIPNNEVELSDMVGNGVVQEDYIADHHPNGIFYVKGENIREKISFTHPPTVYDIVPTILYILNIPLPNELDGRVLTEIFEDDSFTLKENQRLRAPDLLTDIEALRLKKAISKLKFKNGERENEKDE